MWPVLSVQRMQIIARSRGIYIYILSDLLLQAGLLGKELATAVHEYNLHYRVGHADGNGVAGFTLGDDPCAACTCWQCLMCSSGAACIDLAVGDLKAATVTLACHGVQAVDMAGEGLLSIRCPHMDTSGQPLHFLCKQSSQHVLLFACPCRSCA